MNWSPNYPRRVPAQRPAGFEPRAPRWSAAYESPMTAMTSDYIAVQTENRDDPATAAFLRLVESSADEASAHAPASSELLHTTDADGTWNTVFVGYWTDPTAHARWFAQSPLGTWFRGIDPVAAAFGAWREVIEVPLERLETVYSSPTREFGLAACAGISLDPITSNGYFGAARDRMPISAIDSLDAPVEYPRRAGSTSSRGRRLRAELGLNVCAIRSGQYWKGATGEQLEDYESRLEPYLMRGMAYLASNQETTGTLSLRILRSGTGGEERPTRETSVLGYFRSLDDLESWASGHPTHHAIHQHAIEKNRQYGDDRTVTTWHEVFVLPESGIFEYVNCAPSTGVLPFARQLWALSDD